MFNDALRTRTFAFAISTVKALRLIPESRESQIFKSQLTKSASSLAANFRASCVSRSQKEWHSKISIAIEETDESTFWLEILENLYPEYADSLAEIKKESIELVKILSKTRGKLSSP
ncbi:MAG TPA: four helix bundle protein [Saprospiraceae bacterium]|nr:four helix bundle protein [Saprospiraceae bacterium]